MRKKTKVIICVAALSAVVIAVWWLMGSISPATGGTPHAVFQAKEVSPLRKEIPAEMHTVVAPEATNEVAAPEVSLLSAAEKASAHVPENTWAADASAAIEQSDASLKENPPDTPEPATTGASQAEISGTMRMYEAHAPLRTAAVANPDSAENREILQTMVTKALARARLETR